MFVRAKTPAPPEAKLTPLRNMEELELPVALKMERYAGGLATPRPAAAKIVRLVCFSCEAFEGIGFVSNILPRKSTKL